MNLSFILGAQDPEMREICKVLEKVKVPYFFASNNGYRSNSGNAYQSDGAVIQKPSGYCESAVLVKNATYITVECSVKNLEIQENLDHHNEGDSGFAMEPKDYLNGSSLGQTLSFFGETPTSDQKLLCAADHCLTAAYRGDCLDVDPDELLFSRTAWLSKILNLPLGEVINDVFAAKELINKNYCEKAEMSFFLDPLNQPNYIAEASAYVGKPICYRRITPEGNTKEMLKGGTFTQISDFIERHKLAGRRVYGNPYRGYAGAYL